MGHKRQTVLVVDDDGEWNQLLCAALSPTYRTRVATNGNDALQMARRSPPALIILDVMMPGGMDGFRTLYELRKQEATRTIPVIMCTEVNAIADTTFTPEDLDRYLGTAPSVLLEKPISPSEMLTQVEALIGRANPESNTTIPAR